MEGWAFGDLIALTTIHDIVRRMARMNPRAAHPNTYQRLLALTTETTEPLRSPVDPVAEEDEPLSVTPMTHSSHVGVGTK